MLRKMRRSLTFENLEGRGNSFVVLEAHLTAALAESSFRKHVLVLDASGRSGFRLWPAYFLVDSLKCHTAPLRGFLRKWDHAERSTHAGLEFRP